MRRAVGLECRPIASVLIGDIGLSEWPKDGHITRWRDSKSETIHLLDWNHGAAKRVSSGKLAEVLQ